MTRLSTNTVLVEYLLTVGALTTLTSTRIWGGSPFPPRGADYKPSDGEAICLNVVAGADDYTDLLRHEMVQFKCYAPTRVEADTLAGVLHEALENKQTAKIKWARRVQTHRSLIEPDTEWIFSLAQYGVMVRQEV